jgi:F-type H+-transporting ATPase subunit b
MLTHRALLASPLVLLPRVALAAAEGGAAGADLLYPTINFLLLVGALVYFTRKPIQAFFADRRDSIRKELDEASGLHRQAEENFARWQRQLVDLEREVESIRTTARERAEHESEQILADARASAERIRGDAANAVDQELRRAQKRLREEASDLAIELAAGILREQVTDQDRGRLLDEFIARVGETPRSHGAGS